MHDQSRHRQPVVGYAAVLVALTDMVCYSLLSWDDMPAQVISRQAAGRHGAPVFSRAFSVVVMPAMLIILALLFLLMPVWNRLVRSAPLRSGLGRRQPARVWSTVLVMLSALLLFFHIGIINLDTGRGPQLPELACYGLAAVLVGRAVICFQQAQARRVVIAALVLDGVLARTLPYPALGFGTAINAFIGPQVRPGGTAPAAD